MDYDIFVIKVGRSNIFVINRFWKEKKNWILIDGLKR